MIALVGLIPEKQASPNAAINNPNTEQNGK